MSVFIFGLHVCSFVSRLGKVENVDTSTFRMATWNYIHLIFGIYHDDYLYTEVRSVCLSFLSYNVICLPVF